MLKEEDPLIELIREWIMAPIDESAGLQLSTLEVFTLVEDMINEHVKIPHGSRLKKYIPKVKRMFMPLNLMDAVHAYDAVTHFSRRKRVPPTFKDVRHILNLATVHERDFLTRSCTMMMMMMGDYCESSDMVTVIVELLKKGKVVSLVTAAGYPGEPQRYEARLRGVMGGECNYLHITSRDADTGAVSLRVVDPVEWKDGRGQRWDQAEVDQLLDQAQV
ncbi:hypothetical protein DYB38_002905 [Aphanomyces astaci]|uniref:IMP-specific 5'-nucleotidase 1 n=1 Tax=Aphanomyces astaci TaxID=112090 RepID=A0A397C6M9_APHAT|nr:hypothetical protein DYB38_002905 [Aphanomyces astaci]